MISLPVESNFDAVHLAIKGANEGREEVSMFKMRKLQDKIRGWLYCSAVNCIGHKVGWRDRKVLILCEGSEENVSLMLPMGTLRVDMSKGEFVVLG